MERHLRPGARKLRRRSRTGWLLLPATAWLVVFYLVPMAAMATVSLQQGSLERGYRFTWHWAIYPALLGRYGSQLIRSLTFALVATAACLVIAFPLAYAIAFRAKRSRNVLLFLVVLPFFVSLVIRTLSWKFVLADHGTLASALALVGIGHSVHVLNTPVAVLGGLIYNYLPFMALPLYVALERMDPEMLHASADLYAGRVRTFWRVTAPLALPGVVAGTLLTFVPITGDYINAELLGGPGQEMIGNVIQRQFLVVNDYPAAAALSFVLLAAIFASVVVYARVAGVEELIA